LSEKDEKPPKMDPATKEAWDYLIDVIGDYEAFLFKIGDLGLSAPQVLYYRDEVQEFLEELTDNPQVNFQGAWQKVNELDQILRDHSQDLVNEIGHSNFLQYQLVNDPPKKHWWWWINRVTEPPPPPPKVWQFWKHQAFNTQESAKSDEPKETPSILEGVDPEVAKLFRIEGE
jgi:hypothetical protein